MAILISQAPVEVGVEISESVYSSNYEDFENGRRATAFGDAEKKVFTQQSKKFKREVIDPLDATGGIKIGEHYIFKVSDIKALIEMSPEADYLHIYNTLADDNFNYMYAIPVDSSIKSDTKFIISETSMLLSAFPCPPDPRCPKIAQL